MTRKTEINGGTTQEEAAGKCYGIWREAKKEQIRVRNE